MFVVFGKCVLHCRVCVSVLCLLKVLCSVALVETIKCFDVLPASLVSVFLLCRFGLWLCALRLVC